MSDNKMAKGLIAGFLAGSLVGAVIALLYAPKTGKELRGDIKRKSSELMDEAEEYLAAADVHLWLISVPIRVHS